MGTAKSQRSLFSSVRAALADLDGELAKLHENERDIERGTALLFRGNSITDLASQPSKKPPPRSKLML